jgi:hypothetical protein
VGGGRESHCNRGAHDRCVWPLNELRCGRDWRFDDESDGIRFGRRASPERPEKNWGAGACERILERSKRRRHVAVRRERGRRVGPENHKSCGNYRRPVATLRAKPLFRTLARLDSKAQGKNSPGNADKTRPLEPVAICDLNVINRPSTRWMIPGRWRSRITEIV